MDMAAQERATARPRASVIATGPSHGAGQRRCASARTMAAIATVATYRDEANAMYRDARVYSPVHPPGGDESARRHPVDRDDAPRPCPPDQHRMVPESRDVCDADEECHEKDRPRNGRGQFPHRVRTEGRAQVAQQPPGRDQGLSQPQVEWRGAGGFRKSAKYAMHMPTAQRTQLAKQMVRARLGTALHDGRSWRGTSSHNVMPFAYDSVPMEARRTPTVVFDHRLRPDSATRALAHNQRNGRYTIVLDTPQEVLVLGREKRIAFIRNHRTGR